MSKKVKSFFYKSCMMFIFALGLLVIPGAVKAFDISAYDEIFGNGEFEVVTNIQLGEYRTKYDLFNNVLNKLYYAEMDDNYNWYSYNLRIDDSDNNDNYKVNLYKSYIADDGNYTSEKITTNPYQVHVTINNNYQPYFEGVINSDGKIVFNYDDSMFESDSDKKRYISNNIDEYNKTVNGLDYSYGYIDYNNQVVNYISKNNTTINAIILDFDLDDFVFEYTETEYSDTFKQFSADGTYVIKSDVTMDDETISDILDNLYINYDGYSITAEGNVKNGKVFFVRKKYVDGRQKTIERHLITLVAGDIDEALFAKAGIKSVINIKAQEPAYIDYNNNKDNYIDEYLRYILNYYYDETTSWNIDYYKGFVRFRVDNYDTDNGVLINTSTQYKKVDFNFVGYDDKYSDAYILKVGKEIILNSDYADKYMINQLLNYSYPIYYCNADVTKCDIGLVDKDKGEVEIHSVNIKLNNTLTDTFKNVFKIDNDGNVTVIKDSDITFGWRDNYNFWNQLTNEGYEFECEDEYCDLKYSKSNYVEKHNVPVNYVSKERSSSYNAKVKDKLVLYPGENENAVSDLENGNGGYYFSTDRTYNISSTQCSTATKTCNVAIFNGDNTLEVHKVPFELKEGKSPEFEAMLPGNKIKLNAVHKDGLTYQWLAGNAYLATKTKSWFWYEAIRDENKATILLDSIESHTYDVEWEEADPAKQEVIDEIIKKVDDERITIKFNDLDIINHLYYDVNLESGSFNSKELNDKMKNVIDNQHVSYRFVPWGGLGDQFFMQMGGNIVFYYDGVAYGTNKKELTVQKNNVLYIPTDTEKTIDAYMKAAQKRVDDYLGANSGLTINYGGLATESDYSDVGATTANGNGHYYIAQYGNRAVTLLVVADSSKMKKLEFAANDIINNINVTSENAIYPTDTIVSGEIYDKDSDEFKKYAELLGTEDIQVVDINLFSTSNGDIKNFNGTDFDVTLPVDTDLDLDGLVVYYIDEENNTYEEHEASIDNIMVDFETTHFSTYIIANKNDVDLSKFKNPNTGDKLITYIILTIVASIATIAVGFQVFKKEN